MQWDLTLVNKLCTISGHVLAQESLQTNNYNYLASNEADWTKIQCWVVLGP